ncbi:Hypothetical protein A7982_11405 [Minicystis rosea]|nr:Hypothetical protein A7982_11405 [Minicystis rosea]
MLLGERLPHGGPLLIVQAFGAMIRTRKIYERKGPPRGKSALSGTPPRTPWA